MARSVPSWGPFTFARDRPHGFRTVSTRKARSGWKMNQVRNASATILLLLAWTVGHAQPASPFGPAAAWLVVEGDSLLRMEKPQKAVDKYTQAIDMEPSASNYSARARAWYQMDRMDRFLLDTEKALKIDSTHAEANYQRALYALRSEDYRTAERLSTRALDHGAKNRVREQALIVRGEARAELRKTKEAIADLKAGLGDRTEDLPAMKTLARMHDAQKDHAASLSVLEKLCTVEPGDIGNWTNRGFELAALGRYEEALTIYGKALTLDKDEPTALSDRAYALHKLGRNQEAMVDVERSLKSYPSNAFALHTRALLRLAKGEREKACADLHLAHIIGGVAEVDALLEKNCGGIQQKR